MKYLVEVVSGNLKVGFQAPLSSSIAGHYVMDSPDELGVIPTSNDVPAFTAQKLQAYLDAHPNLPNSASDEFGNYALLDISGPPVSDGLVTGEGKLAILPGGHVHTSVFTMTGSFTQYFLHYSNFFLGKVFPGIADAYPEPTKVLYGWDEAVQDFAVPSAADIRVDLVNDVMSAPYDNLVPSDTVRSLSGLNLDVRLKFTNLGTKTFYLSDWYMLWG